MRREDLKELHYITHIANVRSILIRGIYCYERARKVEHRSFAMAEVQDIRDGKLVPGGLPLHSYVNLYICAHNAALYKIHDRHEDLCVLRVSRAILDATGVMVSDRNAAAGSARFASGPDGLALVDRKLVFATTWRHRDDPQREDHHKKATCAEVLVPDRVPGQYVFGAYVSCVAAKVRLRDHVPDFDVVMHPNLFFLHAEA